VDESLERCRPPRFNKTRHHELVVEVAPDRREPLHERRRKMRPRCLRRHQRVDPPGHARRVAFRQSAESNALPPPVVVKELEAIDRLPTSPLSMYTRHSCLPFYCKGWRLETPEGSQPLGVSRFR